MNQLINTEITMSSLEIAELLSSRHDKVKQSIDRLVKRGIIVQPPMGSVLSKDTLGRNRDISIYVFSGEKGKRDSIIVVAQLSPEFTARLVDRWQELEQMIANKQKKIPQTYSEALQLAADQAKQLEEQAPKVQYYDTVAKNESHLNATQVGQKIGLSGIALNKLLDQIGVYNRSVKRGRVFQQWFVDKGFGLVKQTALGYSQAVFTAKGEQYIIEKLTQEGLI